ncbi:MAG: DUF5317 family protein [Eubacteriales bacterium]|nr:DUF5317 family protein [Eubacteriales bacterium]
MYLFILAGLLIAKIKKYRVFVIFHTIDFYPLFFVEAVYIFFQANALFDNYSYVKYSKLIQMAFTISLLLPILRRKLYAQSIAGAGLVVAGTLMNKLVISANEGKMPVFATLSKLTGYYKEGIFSKGIDELHIEMSSSTKLNFLADYIDTGFSIMSIGDVLIHSFVSIILYYSIKSMDVLDIHGGK